jgi:FixJ family two-component response regulator
MSDAGATIIVVDDDEAVRESIESLLQSVGFEVRQFASVNTFLEADLPAGPRCMVLDIRMHGKSGLDLQADLLQKGVDLPIIFITGHGDIAMSVRAMKAGAVEFLTKPFRDQDLLDAIQAALDRDRTSRAAMQSVVALRRKFETLTSREREIMAYVSTGLLNKQIAAAVGLSEITVKVHRGHMMHKMGAGSVADLVRMADQLGVCVPPGGTSTPGG